MSAKTRVAVGDNVDIIVRNPYAGLSGRVMEIRDTSGRQHTSIGGYAVVLMGKTGRRVTVSVKHLRVVSERMEA